VRACVGLAVLFEVDSVPPLLPVLRQQISGAAYDACKLSSRVRKMNG
jgi:hypothetical protein